MNAGGERENFLVDVAVPLPLFQTFTYAAEPAARHPLVAGSRVVVPFRGRKVVGYALGESDGKALGTAVAKKILDVADAQPVFRPDLIAVCKWISDYYVTPLGLVLRAALPAALGAAKRPQPAVKSRRILRLAAELPSLMERDKAFGRSPKQRVLFELLESMGGHAPVDQLTKELGTSVAVVNALVTRNFAQIETETVERDPFRQRILAAPTEHEPTPAQAEAIRALVSAKPGDVALLHGITGSGKTLVYIELLKHVVREQGRSAIVLVPEIALTPQTVDRFRAVFGDQVAVLPSALSDGERYDAWLANKNGPRRIAVRARPAIFAPLEDLGAIIVDEEHEASYKQGEAPRYHAREVAIVRARESGAVCRLANATPTPERRVDASAGEG